jgi:excisionase family DNA binding protein
MSKCQSNDVLLRPRDAAELLAVSERKLWAMTHEESPGLPHVKFGRSIRYPLGELLVWIKTRQIGGGNNE